MTPPAITDPAGVTVTHTYDAHGDLVATTDADGNAARLDGLDKFRTRGKGKVFPAPETEPLRIGEVVDRRRARGRDIDHAGIRQLVLEAQARPALLRCLGITTLALGLGGIGHGMAFVEHDHSVEVRTQPIDDLPDPRNPFLARVGP